MLAGRVQRAQAVPGRAPADPQPDGIGAPCAGEADRRTPGSREGRTPGAEASEAAGVSTIARAWGWTKRNAVALLSAIAVVLAGVLAWTTHRRRVGSLRDEIAVEKAGKLVAALDARREALAERDDDVAEEIAEVQRERTRVMREAVAIVDDVERMSDEQVVRAWQEIYRGR